MKKLLTIALCLVLMVSVFTGCTSSQDTAQDTQEPEASDEKVVIEIVWQQEITQQLWDMPIAQFQEKYPNVEVNLEVIPSAADVIRNRMASGNAPDIFYTWASDYDFYGMIKEGLVWSVDDILAQDTLEGDMKLEQKILQAGLKMGNYDGKNYMLPITQFITLAFYDKKLFDDNSMNYEYSTVAEFEAILQSAVDNDITPMEYAGVYQFYLGDVFVLPMIYSESPQAFDAINNNEEGAWLDPAVVKTIETIQGWVEKGYIDKASLAMDHVQSQIDFINHNCAVIPVGTWLEGEMAGQWPEDFELSPMICPSFDGEDQAATAVIEAMMLPKNDDTAAKEEYLAELIKLFYSQENAKKFLEESSYLMAYEDIPEEINAILPGSVRASYELLKTKDAELIVPMFKFVNKETFVEYQNNINALVSGEVTAQQFCEKVEEAASSVR